MHFAVESALYEINNFISYVFLTENCFSHPVGNNKPPELWSWFKDLEKSVKACEIRSSFILQNLHFENRTENQYGI